MDADIKIKWIEALRSGPYPQEREALRTPDGYCCLGVLCDIVAPEGWGPDLEHGEDVDYPNKELLASCDLAMGDVEPLARMNDEGVSFAGIADVIERSL